MAAAPAAVPTVVDAIRAKSPLVHCVTNFVSMDLAANVLLAAHASPAMVHAPEEAGGFASIAGAVVINVGTIDSLWADGMRAAWTSVSTNIMHALLMLAFYPFLPTSPCLASLRAYLCACAILFN
jgi:hypothetical protein